MANEKTWQFDIGRVNPGAATVDGQAGAILWYIKALLTGTLPSNNPTLGLWSVHYSCDSVTAGTPGDGVDHWADASKVVVSSTGVGGARSWCVLKRVFSTGDTIYLTLHANGSTTTGTTYTNGWAQLYYSKLAPSGGSTTAGPTFPADATPTMANAQYGTVQLTASAAAHHLSGGLATDGETAYVISSVDASGRAEYGFIFTLLKEPKPGDAWPYWMYSTYNASTTGAFDSVQITGFASPPRGTIRTFNGASVSQGVAIMPAVSTGTFLSTSAGVNASDPVDSTYFALPLYLMGNGAQTSTSIVASGTQIKGRVPDFRIGPGGAVGQGTADDAPGSILSMMVGCLWVPSNASVSF